MARQLTWLVRPVASSSIRFDTQHIGRSQRTAVARWTAIDRPGRRSEAAVVRSARRWRRLRHVCAPCAPVDVHDAQQGPRRRLACDAIGCWPSTTEVLQRRWHTARYQVQRLSWTAHAVEHRLILERTQPITAGQSGDASAWSGKTLCPDVLPDAGAEQAV
jgi:hypothetical protein